MISIAKPTFLFFRLPHASHPFFWVHLIHLVEIGGGQRKVAPLQPYAPGILNSGCFCFCTLLLLLGNLTDKLNGTQNDIKNRKVTEPMNEQTNTSVAPRLKALSPCFFVQNVPDSVEYYLSALGFEVEKLWGEPAAFATLRKDGFTLMLHEVADENSVAPNGQHEDAFDLYLQTDQIDALFANLSARNAQIHSPLETRTDYAMREFSVRDLDGYVLVFAQPL